VIIGLIFHSKYFVFVFITLKYKSIIVFGSILHVTHIN